MGEQLLYVVLKHGAICRALKYSREQDPVLYVGRQNLILLIAVELGYLNWCYAEGGPAGSPETDALVAARLIDEDKVVQLELCQVVEVKVSQVRVLLPTDLLSNLLRLSHRL
jgi:hypothetical protein